MKSDCFRAQMLNVVVVCSLERGLMQCVYLVRAGMELLGLFAVRRVQRRRR